MNDIQQQLKALNTTMEGKMNEILKNNPSVIEYNDLSTQVESLTTKIDSLKEVIENAKEAKTYEIVTENTPKLKVYQDLLNELGTKKTKAYNALNKCLERENYTELNNWEQEYETQRKAILKPLKQELIDTYKPTMPFRFAPRHTLELKCAMSLSFIFYLLFATMFLKLEVHYRAR